jgi:hypothetical protein
MYELMQSCWQSEPAQRPRFASIKEMLVDVQFTLADCRHVESSTTDTLPMSVGDKVIVLEGTAEHYYWFGQNTRTRGYGKFARKNIVIATREHVNVRRRNAPVQQLVSHPLRGAQHTRMHGKARFIRAHWSR